MILGRAASVLALFCVLSAGGASAQINTGLDASGLSFVTCNGRAAFRTMESHQAAADLNGDLDAGDAVLRVLDLGLGTTTTVPIDASGELACGGDLFAFGVGEANQAVTDLNGDLDMDDTVLHVYDAATTTLTPIGLAVSTIAASSSLVAFAVPEASQGAGGTDLNLDGDKTDQVLHVYDPVGGTTTNVGIDASGDVAVVGTTVAFHVSEAAQGNSILNGDGDAIDMVLHIYEAGTATLTNTGRQAQPGIQFEGDVVAFLVNEKEQNLGLNADTDKSDLVLTLYCLNSPPCVSSGLINVGLAAPRAVGADRGFTLSGDLVAIATPERNQNNLDLNSDGNLSDRVVQVYQVSTGTVTNTAFAIRRTPRISGNYVAFGVEEKQQGRTDLNGDGDARDTVVHVYDALTSTTTNTGRAIGIACKNTEIPTVGDCFGMGGDVLVLQTDERKQGRTVLNGDGDASDMVVEIWRLSTSTLTNTGLASDKFSGIAVGSSIAAFRAAERPQQTDFNGDFDRRDPVMAVFDSTLMTTTVFPTQADSLFLVEGSTVVYRTIEGAQGADLNLDGDLDDGVIGYQGF
jgi:hypothetical protein